MLAALGMLGQERRITTEGTCNFNRPNAKRVPTATRIARLIAQSPFEFATRSKSLHPIFPVILSGGSGTRLWPMSRAMFPKQFVEKVGPVDESLLGTTALRLASSGFEAPILVCNHDHRFLVNDVLERVGVEAGRIVIEPTGRSTAVAIAVAALLAVREDKDAILVAMPSDHLIDDREAFVKAARQAAEVAAMGQLVLFGIKPRSPHTGYGYIQRGEPLQSTIGGAFEVKSFVEKPDKATAERYVNDGHYYWNSGIFTLHASTYLAELERLQPAIHTAAKDAIAAAEIDDVALKLDEEAFAASPNMSVDYAVMERTNRAVLIPIDIGWSDIGSWASLWDVSKQDADRNAIYADAFLEDTSDSYIQSETGIVAALGVKDLIVVNTPDALLVADKSRAEDVSGIVQELRLTNRREHEQHLRHHRPWGHFETLSLGERFQVKKLHVKPGGKLSMQMHHHRSEHWVVVQGTAKVTVGEIERLLRENESVYIFATQWHRLENPGKVPLEIIEVQIGTYLGEDDILRSDDIYKREASETK
jgi:mannose-1-phosphate guanylyltransferase/mannose-6-phosphate isomerase